ncbi:MAG: hypothetical protein U0869_08775 [Chloroflexota bacterium]
MSTHSNSHLVSGHQSRLHTEAREARLAKEARAAKEERLALATKATSSEPTVGLLTQLMRVVRRAGREVATTAPRPATTITTGTGS